MLSEKKKLQLEFALNEDMGVSLAIPLGVVTGLALALAMWLIMSSSLKIGTKEDKELSKRLRKIINDETQFRVMVAKTPERYAYTAGTKDIFISSGLIERYRNNPRMIDSILLHEAGHYYHKDTYKRVLTSTTFFGPLFAALFYGLTGPNAWLVVFMGFILSHALIVIQGRPQEFTADLFADKYGYREERIQVLKDYKKDEDKMRTKVPKSLRLVYRGLEKLGELMDEHPKLDDRIKGMMKSKKLSSLAKISNKSVLAKKIGILVFSQRKE